MVPFRSISLVLSWTSFSLFILPAARWV